MGIDVSSQLVAATARLLGYTITAFNFKLGVARARCHRMVLSPDGRSLLDTLSDNDTTTLGCESVADDIEKQYGVKFTDDRD